MIEDTVESVDTTPQEDVPTPDPAPPASEPEPVQPSAPASEEAGDSGEESIPQDTENPVLDGLEGDGGMSVIGEPVTEVPAPTPEPRPFLTTPFEEYTVVEGFLLVFLLCLFIAGLYQLVRRFI